MTNDNSEASSVTHGISGTRSSEETNGSANEEIIDGFQVREYTKKELTEIENLLNSFSVELKTVVARALGDNSGELSEWLKDIGRQRPERALKLWIELSEIVLPKMSRMEHTGAGGGSIDVKHSKSDEELLAMFMPNYASTIDVQEATYTEEQPEQPEQPEPEQITHYEPEPEPEPATRTVPWQNYEVDTVDDDDTNALGVDTSTVDVDLDDIFGDTPRIKSNVLRKEGE